MEDLNREERRRTIARTAAQIIAREGIDAATMRHIAAAVGCSTTLITDSFDDKTELLLAAYRLVSADTLTAFEQRMADDPAGIIEGLVSLSAIDGRAWWGWRVHVAFLERSVRDPVLAAAQQSVMTATREYIESAIRKSYGPNEDCAAAARLLITLIHGVSVQVLFERQSWSREEIRALVAKQLTMALGREPLPP